MDSDDLVVALDVGGTSIKGGLVDRAGRVVREIRRDTRVAAGPDAVIGAVLECAAELAGSVPPAASVVAAGLCVPGTVDAAAGVARHAVNLGWRDVPFGDLLADRLGVPVALGHDVRTAALGEARYGAGPVDPSVRGDRPVRSMFFLAIGTGIAGGLVRYPPAGPQDNRGAPEVDDGDAGLAGEVGHLVVRRDGPQCACGNRGCLETLASASRIAARYRDLTGEQVSAREVAERVGADDPAAARVWDDGVQALADAVAALTMLIDPGAVVLGGGLSLAGAALLEPLVPAVAARMTFRSPPRITLSRLGDRAGLLGAAARAWEAR